MREATGCRIGFCYTANDSKFVLKDTLSLELMGAEILHPKNGSCLYALELQANSDHIVLFRQVEPKCSYGYSNQTIMRRKSAQELVEETKRLPIKPIGNTNVVMQLYNELDGCCFFFNNNDTRAIQITVKFNTDKTKNLKLEGASAKATNDFTLTIQPS